MRLRGSSRRFRVLKVVDGGRALALYDVQKPRGGAVLHVRLHGLERRLDAPGSFYWLAQEEQLELLPHHTRKGHGDSSAGEYQ